MFFELFWLDIIPVGTFLPPVRLFSTIASLCLVQALGIHHPSEIAMVMLLTIPFASLGTWIDAKQRFWQNREFNELVVSTRRGNAKLFAPEHFIRKGIVNSFLLQGVFCLTSLFVLAAVLDFLLPYVHHYSGITWPVLWLLASIGGVLSLRFRRGMVYFGVSVLVIACVLWISMVGMV